MTKGAVAPLPVVGRFDVLEKILRRARARRMPPAACVKPTHSRLQLAMKLSIAVLS
jgi:hypothetical protein